jgi:endonuclease G
MDQRERSKRLKAMMESLLPNGGFDSPRSTLESLGINQESLETADKALECLRSEETLTDIQSNQLEAIIHRQLRPALFVIGNTFDRPPAPWESLGASENREHLERAIRSIGRIELPGNAWVPYGGTGFVVGNNLVMTNRHVAELFSLGLGTRNLQWKGDHRSGINFRRELMPTPNVLDIAVKKVLMIHPYWDVAILEVDGLDALQPTLSLSIRNPDELEDRKVAIIGYPAQDQRNDLELQNQIFGGVYGVKRLQPGLLKSRRTVSSFNNDVNAITHDASTLGGNSGSAVVDVLTGDILAIHFAGIYLDANFAVPTYELARDSRVVDAGVNFRGSIEMTNLWDDRWREADKGVESVSTTSSNADAKPHSPGESFLQGGTIPIRITVSIGEPEIRRSSDTSTRTKPVQSEGTFGKLRESENEIDRGMKLASIASLSQPNFAWRAALTGAIASHFAYVDSFETVRAKFMLPLGISTLEMFHIRDTQGFIALKEDVVLLAFRGTSSPRDWIRDLTLYSTATELGTLHAGFYHGYMQSRREILRLLKAVDASKKKLAVVGHSLGGALAAIATRDLANLFPIVSVYTYGQPAVGKKDFVSEMRSIEPRYYRLVNADDVVAKVPPGYIHFGTLKHLGQNTSFARESNELLENTASSSAVLSEAQFTDLQRMCNTMDDPQSARLESLFSGFSDHSLLQYASKIVSHIHAG